MGTAIGILDILLIIGGFLFVLLLCAGGVVAILYPFLRFRYVRKHYVELSAVCVNVEESQSYDSDADRYTTIYKPIWSYTYNGIQYTSTLGASASFLNMPVGTEKTIYICPEKPEKIYVPYQKLTLFLVIFGAAFVFAGMIFVYSNFIAG